MSLTVRNVETVYSELTKVQNLDQDVSLPT